MRIADLLQATPIDRHDAEILLAHLLGRERAWVLAHSEYDLETSQMQQWQERVARRKLGEPVAYITGTQEFYGRTFMVTPATLIPRPSTETLITEALALVESVNGVGDWHTQEADADIVILSRRWRTDVAHAIVDVGTGSGCIGITLACESPTRHIIATDISELALAVAKCNAQAHGVGSRITFLQGSLLDPVNTLSQPFILVSNPPYIPFETPLMHSVHDYEPHSALFAGVKGLDVLLPLLAQAKRHPYCVGCAVECRKDQSSALTLE